MRESSAHAFAARRCCPVFSTWLSIPSSFSAELMAHTGFDCLTIDMQHGLIDSPDGRHAPGHFDDRTPSRLPACRGTIWDHHEAARRRLLPASSAP